MGRDRRHHRRCVDVWIICASHHQTDSLETHRPPDPPTPTDTHVHRISNRLGWADTWNHKNPKAQNPEKTRKLLESWLPKEHWKEVNPLMVGLGQTVCRAIGPKCHECAITHLCPSYIPPEACL